MNKQSKRIIKKVENNKKLFTELKLRKVVLIINRYFINGTKKYYIKSKINFFTLKNKKLA